MVTKLQRKALTKEGYKIIGEYELIVIVSVSAELFMQSALCAFLFMQSALCAFK